MTGYGVMTSSEYDVGDGEDDDDDEATMMAMIFTTKR